MKSRVTTSCTDATGTQNLISVVTMMQDCSMMWMEQQAATERWLNETNGAMLVASREVEIRRRPRYGEFLTVSTWVYKVQSFMGYRNTCIFDEDGQATAACWCTGVFVNRETGKTLRVPDYVRDSMGLEPAFDMEYGKRKIVLPEVEPQKLEPVRAKRSDIDFNGHVNNAQYVRMAYERLPLDFDPRHLRITHDGQARCGDLIDLALYEDADVFDFVLSGEEGQTIAVIEFA